MHDNNQQGSCPKWSLSIRMSSLSIHCVECEWAKTAIRMDPLENWTWSKTPFPSMHTPLFNCRLVCRSSYTLSFEMPLDFSRLWLACLRAGEAAVFTMSHEDACSFGTPSWRFLLQWIQRIYTRIQFWCKSLRSSLVCWSKVGWMYMYMYGHSQCR